MIVILIIAAAVLIAEGIAWSMGGRLSHRRASLYDHLANGEAVSAPADDPSARIESKLIAGANRYADIWIAAPLVILVAVVVAYPLVPGTALFARNINYFLLASFWVSILLGVCAAILWVVSFVIYQSTKQTTQFWLAVYLLLMAIIFGGLTWLIYSPPRAPAGTEEAFYQLVAFQLSDTNWTQLANNFLNQYKPQTEFLFMQVIGLPFMLMALLDVLYILGCSLYAHLTQRWVPISVNLLILAPILAGAASLCFGIF